jgi:hypothetical protein
MNDFQVKGKVQEIFAEQTVGNDLKKRAFLISNEEIKGENTFKHEYYFECLGDKTTLLNDLSVGQEITVFFNIKVTKWAKDGKTQYFTNTTCWKIEK